MYFINKLLIKQPNRAKICIENALLTKSDYIMHNNYMRVYGQGIKDEVRALRILGLSLNEIHKEKSIPSTTIRGWISDITLTNEQTQNFKRRILLGLQEGRIKAQRAQKEKRGKRERELREKGIQEIGFLTKRDLFIAGVALYWAEGFKNKHEHRLGFCNSDPMMMKFYLKWLKECLGVGEKDLVARATVNYSYEKNIDEIQMFWSDFLEIPLTQFTKPFFQQTTWKKQFNDDSYKGVLRVHVKESLEPLWKMRGWIEGLKMLK